MEGEPPPKLDYATPRAQYRPDPVVCAVAFVIYGLIFLVLLAAIYSIAANNFHGGDGWSALLCSLIIFGPLCGVMLWRCIAAFRGLLWRPK